VTCTGPSATIVRLAGFGEQFFEPSTEQIVLTFSVEKEVPEVPIDVFID